MGFLRPALSAAWVIVLLAAAPASAVPVLQAGVSFPDSVAVGDTGVSSSVQFTYNGTGKLVLSSIKLTPSCATQTLPCTPSDTGVFAIGNGVGAGTCEGRAFGASAPAADGTVTLTAIPGDSHNPTVDPLEVTSGGTCTIALNVSVLKLPGMDASAATPGVQTIQQVQVAGTSSPDGQAQSAGGFDETTVRKRTPSVTQSAFGSERVGGQVSDIATLLDAFSPSGTITFNLFGPDDPTCAAPPAFTSNMPLDFLRTTSSPFLPTAPGTYRWTAAYSGDVNNDPVLPVCNAPGASLVVSKAAPTLRLGALAPAGAGATIRGTASLGGAVAPSGTITFRAFAPGDAFCTGRPVAVSTVPANHDGGYSSAPFVAPSAGTFGWQATYSGDARNEPATVTRCGSPAIVAGSSSAPDLGRPRLSPSSFRAARAGRSITARVGTLVRYTLSKQASVTFRVERASSGRRAGGRCVKPRRSLRHAKRCTRYPVVRGSFTHQGHAGSNTFTFRGRVGGRKLRPGRYRLRALARDAAGRKSQVRRRAFRILR
jgi:hypothetical protein